MADPISIASSVAGLLGAGAKLVAIMSPIVNNADAPPLCRAVLTELCENKAILHQVEHLLAGRLPGGVGAAPLERRELVLFEQLAAALTGCVMTKDELETLVDDLGLVYSETGITGVFDRARWMRKEKEIARLLARLQNHKRSLGCMLNVFTADSTLEIRESVVQLYALFEQAIANDSALSLRLARLEGTDSTVGRPHTEVGTVLREDDQDEDGESVRTARQSAANEPARPDVDVDDVADLGSQLASLALELETALQNSRAYRRHLLTTSDAHSETSATTSTRRRAAASIFSAISLADISNLSLYSLPILIQEIGNNHWYVQVGRPTKNPDRDEGGRFFHLEVKTMSSLTITIAISSEFLGRDLVRLCSDRGGVAASSLLLVYEEMHKFVRIDESKTLAAQGITARSYGRIHMLLKYKAVGLSTAAMEQPFIDAEPPPEMPASTRIRRLLGQRSSRFLPDTTKRSALELEDIASGKISEDWRSTRLDGG